MLVDVEILPYLLKADNGCPKCQYIMADHYKHGIGVPKDRERAKYYYKLLASNDPENLTFLDTCYSTLLLLIGYLDYTDNNDAEAAKYFNLAASYIRSNYAPQIAAQKIAASKLEKYMSTIKL